MDIIKPTPLTADAFAPFGTVIAPRDAESYLINNDKARRYHAMASVDTATAGGRGIISMFRAAPIELPFEIAMLERHPLSSQAFLPRGDAAWLVVVAAGDSPQAKDVKAFIAKGDEGVQYNKGTWHHPLLVLNLEQDFWVIDRAGEGENLEEIYFAGSKLRLEL